MIHREYSTLPIRNWIAAAIGAAGAIGSAYMNSQRGPDTYAGIEFAREQMNFNKRETDSVHQRAVEDLKKAGLNPILAAGDGNPAASGASPTIPVKPPIVFDVIPALNLLNQQKELELKERHQQNEDDITDKALGKKEAEIEKTRYETELKKRDLKRGEGRDLLQDSVNEMLKMIKKSTDKPFKDYKMPQIPNGMTAPNLHPGM